MTVTMLLNQKSMYLSGAYKKYSRHCLQIAEEQLTLRKKKSNKKLLMPLILFSEISRIYQNKF